VCRNGVDDGGSGIVTKIAGDGNRSAPDHRRQTRTARHDGYQEDPGVREEEQASSMPELPEVVLPESADPHAAEVLFGIAMASGKQEGQSTALATEAGES